MSLLLCDCTSKCHSVRHGLDIVSVLTRGTTESQVKAFLSVYCHNSSTVKDEFGRTALHLAASVGKKGVLDWLLDVKGADIGAKERESGWTALHRSVFYGNIDCLISLVKHGGSLNEQDKEGLTVLDLTMKDRPYHLTFKNTDPTEVYTWGNNTNFTLGHGNQQSKYHPELVDIFPRTGVYIKQVVLCKFHSVFLSQKGTVYTCGHGQGGRLGHGDEQTYLFPCVVEGLLGHHCTHVAAAKDHTVVLTDDGCVFSFGLNNFHQLGIVPPPAMCNVPKQILSKTLKGRTVIGVAVGRFHTVLWTKDAVYTMGLNGGQLGYLLDPNGDRYVSSPRQVSALHHKDMSISMVAASNGATVCATEKGDIYLLTDHLCKKISSKQFNLKKLVVTGGILDHRVDAHILKEGGGENVSILVLDEAGRVFSWNSSSGTLKLCRWVYGRQVYMSDIALNKNVMMFVTLEGEGFSGHWVNATTKKNGKKDDSIKTGNTLDSSCYVEAGSTYERIRLQKISFIHRAVSITADTNGRNFAVLQSDPKTSLYEIPSVSSSTFSEDFNCLLTEADEMDNIHDLTLQVKNRTFPVHKYILSMRSDYFRKYFHPGSQLLLPGDLECNEDTLGCAIFSVENVQADIFKYLLQFIYTDSCDFLIDGFIVGTQLNEMKNDYLDPLISNLQKTDFNQNLKGMSAYEVYQNRQVVVGNEKGKAKNIKKCKCVNEETNPVKMLQSIAKKYGVTSLAARLDGVKFDKGKVIVLHKKTGNKPKFHQKQCPYLCDVTLRSKDGKEFPCHKCVLCARLEYFRSMLSSSWIEATSCSVVEMPISADVLQVIVDYVYTDEAPAIKEASNVEFICNVLAVADQLLITRLKEMCEVTITEKLTLKNAAELLEFAAMYSANQLKMSCMQFTVFNMAVLLEARALDILSEEVLKELSAAYRKMIPAMQKRIITPYLDGPDLSTFDKENWECLESCKDQSEVDNISRDHLIKKAKSKAKKKPRRRSDSSGGYNLSEILQSPPSPGIVTSGKTNSAESLQELLTSDSEGSCLGVNSPRDLQSPVFVPRSPNDTDEVEKKTMALKCLSRSLESKEEKMCNPFPIPYPKTSRTPPPVLDLRAFMEMEQSLQNRGSTPKSSGSKTVFQAMKLSQKQRKMLTLASKDGGDAKGGEKCTKENSGQSTSTVNPSKNGNPWALPVQSAAVSLSEVLLTQKTMGDSVGSAGKKVSFKNPELHADKKLGPWQLTAVNNLSGDGPMKFAAILEQEQQQEAALIKSREKPLALIQIEESAIQDLLTHYKAFGNPDELILVERALQYPIATPTWNKR
ncbi:inhibitor of Bruton tyrosine kinase isoform X1 [Polypterus senegalus]|nr:inhibitor of Bruton tyrosine kinase isoform X1 [Polypterus senegalus]